MKTIKKLWSIREIKKHQIMSAWHTFHWPNILMGQNPEWESRKIKLNFHEIIHFFNLLKKLLTLVDFCHLIYFTAEIWFALLPRFYCTFPPMNLVYVWLYQDNSIEVTTLWQTIMTAISDIPYDCCRR